MPKKNNGPGLKRMRKLVAPYLVTNGKKFRLKDIDPGDTGGLGSNEKPEAIEMLQQVTMQLAEAQEVLWAQDRQALLIVLQAMDAAGKDSAIKHVMSGVNPQGVIVTSFKRPSAEEQEHDYLWRAVRALPRRGMIGIFNRSYYEEVLIVRVHKNILETEKLPPDCVHKDIFEERFEDISRFERYLDRNGTRVLKVMLHVSKKEQKKRFLERLERPDKHWKFSAPDITERSYWDDYMEAYEEAIRATASEHAPWLVVPADNKWFTRLVMAAAIAIVVHDMHLAFPELTPEERKALARSKRKLEEEK
jgi:PPK2 family polyphosphate:nucleotide phosphotransferase